MDENDCLTFNTNDTRKAYGSRKVIIELDNLDAMLLTATGIPHNQIASFLQNSSTIFPSIYLYLGIDNFKIKDASTCYTINFDMHTNGDTIIKTLIYENRLDEEKYTNDNHYIWNRMFDIGFYTQNPVWVTPSYHHELRKKNYKDLLHTLTTSLMEHFLETLHKEAMYNKYNRIEIK